jgi:hypothetical protein
VQNRSLLLVQHFFRIRRTHQNQGELNGARGTLFASREIAAAQNSVASQFIYLLRDLRLPKV